MISFASLLLAVNVQLATFNVQDFHVNGNEDAKAVDIASDLRKSNSPLISLQEVGNDLALGSKITGTHQTSDILLNKIIAQMPNPTNWGFIYEGIQATGNNHAGYLHRNAILYDRTRIEPVGLNPHSNAVLSSAVCVGAPVGPCTLELRQAGHPIRNALLMPFKVVGNAETFALVNLHLPNTPEFAKHQLRQLTEFLKRDASGHNYILAGDFNLNHLAGHKDITEVVNSKEFVELRDMRNVVMPVNALTGHSQGKIDHIWFISKDGLSTATFEKPEGTHITGKGKLGELRVNEAAAAVSDHELKTTTIRTRPLTPLENEARLKSLNIKSQFKLEQEALKAQQLQLQQTQQAAVETRQTLIDNGKMPSGQFSAAARKKLKKLVDLNNAHLQKARTTGELPNSIEMSKFTEAFKANLHIAKAEFVPKPKEAMPI